MCMVLQFMWKKDFHLHGTYLSLENSSDSLYTFFILLIRLIHFFFLYRSPFSFLCTVFDSILSNIDELLSINLSANAYVFGDFNIHHNHWLTYYDGTDRSGELCYNFSWMVNFPTWIPDCYSHSPSCSFGSISFF